MYHLIGFNELLHDYMTGYKSANEHWYEFAPPPHRWAGKKGDQNEREISNTIQLRE